MISLRIICYERKKKKKNCATQPRIVSSLFSHIRQKERGRQNAEHTLTPMLSAVTLRQFALCCNGNYHFQISRVYSIWYSVPHSVLGCFSVATQFRADWRIFFLSRFVSGWNSSCQKLMRVQLGKFGWRRIPLYLSPDDCAIMSNIRSACAIIQVRKISDKNQFYDLVAAER